MSLKCVYLSLGSNLGCRLGFLREAIKNLEMSNEIVVTQASPIYENRAIGIKGGKDFLNGVIEVFTKLMPYDLLKLTQHIEGLMGRVKLGYCSNRNIDIDILYYEDYTISSNDLTIPHPKVLERDFVLKPLFDLNPNLIIDKVKIADAIVKLNLYKLSKINSIIWPQEQINHIVAFSKNRVIGINGHLPWTIEEDWKIFLKKTTNATLIMGRLSFMEMIKEKEWSIKRKYIVITSRDYLIDNNAVVCVSNVKGAIQLAKSYGKTIWICGGAKIYEEGLSLSNMLHITRIDKDFEGDTFYPNYKSAFKERISCVNSENDELKYAFELWKKV